MGSFLLMFYVFLNSQTETAFEGCGLILWNIIQIVDLAFVVVPIHL